MVYKVEIKQRAIKDMLGFPVAQRERIIEKIDGLCVNLAGDVKKLANHTPEYRLRIGDYRVLFEVSDDNIIVYRVKHRKDAY
jgi:mRNA interferase RelE/StbE